MSCCHLTRRQLLRWSAIASGATLLPGLDRGSAAAAGTALPINLELVTLTETSAIVTWYTAVPGTADRSLQMSPQPTTDNVVSFGTSPLTMTRTAHGAAGTAYHYVELTGLEPGQTYVYMASSDGVPAAPALFAVGNPAGSSVTGAGAAALFGFTTPQPPTGEHLLTLVLCNDLHLGETVAGLITSQAGQQIPPGFTTPEGEPPYAETMAGALVVDARARGGDLLLAAGDVTSEASPADATRAKQILDGFGTHGIDYLVARGNHDRPHTGSDCTAAKEADGTHDCFRDSFFPGSGTGPTWSSQDVHGLHVVRLDTYDKAGNGGDNGILGPEQYAWFAADLAAHADQPTIVFGHHPITVESTLVNASPVRFDLDPQQAMMVEQLYAGAPGVFFHHAGHTHRNKRTVGTTARGVTFQEIGAVKEYPGGFSLLRLHTGGYAMNFYKTRADLAREWSERTRQEDFTVGPFYTFGTVADRNYVVDHDLSGLRTPSPALPESVLAAALPTAGLAAAGAAIALHRRRGDQGGAAGTP